MIINSIAMTGLSFSLKKAIIQQWFSDFKFGMASCGKGPAFSDSNSDSDSDSVLLNL